MDAKRDRAAPPGRMRAPRRIQAPWRLRAAAPLVALAALSCGEAEAPSASRPEALASGDAAPAPGSAPVARAGALGERVLDERAEPYLEDGGSGRRIASLEAKLVATGDRARLRLVTSAVGPGIDPTPGFEGLRGANRITVREQTELLEAGRLAIETRRRPPAASGRPAAPAAGRSPEPRGAPPSAIEVPWSEGAVALVRGTVRALRSGRVPLRRFRADGGLDLLGESERAYVTDLAFDSGALPAGVWRSAVLVDGRPRLEIDFRFDGERGAIEAVRSLGPLDDRASPGPPPMPPPGSPARFAAPARTAVPAGPLPDSLPGPPPGSPARSAVPARTGVSAGPLPGSQPGPPPGSPRPPTDPPVPTSEGSR